MYFILNLLLTGSMLFQAEEIGQRYALHLAKAPLPSLSAQTVPLLTQGSVWFSIDLNRLLIPSETTALKMLSDELFWDTLQDLKVTGLYLENLKPGGAFQLSLDIDPKWGSSAWPQIRQEAAKRHIALIGDAVGSATGAGIDFADALKKVDRYSDLYRLIEIDPSDWKLLPSVALGMTSIPISWLKLQDLAKKGYIPLMTTADWNATKKIQGVDGVARRWIYAAENLNNPVLDWLSPSFAANQLAFGDALHRIYDLGQKISYVDAKLPKLAQECQSMLIRKIGGFSVQKNGKTLQEIKESPCDAAVDTLTREALLHALIAEDTQILRLIYRLCLEEKIPVRSLVHSLQPFDAFACDWSEFALNPQKNYLYHEEMITGELLREKLLKEDLFRIREANTWVGYCALAPQVMGIKDFDKKKQEIQKAHELLALTYAMQPGIFSFSIADLLGAVSEEPLDLMGSNPKALYPALCYQLKNSRSFGSRLKKILEIRESSQIAQGELVFVPPTANPSSLLLVHRLPKSRFIQLLAVNFGRNSIQEKLEMDGIQQTTAIELLSSLTQNKGFDSNQFVFDLPPLSAKVFLFQPKYFD